MAGYWFVDDGDTHFNWSKEPTYRCPLAERADEYPEGLERAASLLGISIERLARMVLRAHSGYGHRARVDDKLTDVCSSCGRKMRRLGYRAWIDEPADEPADGVGAINRRLSAHLGFGEPRRRVRTTWHKTKKEAEAWARHECKRAKATA